MTFAHPHGDIVLDVLVDLRRVEIGPRSPRLGETATGVLIKINPAEPAGRRPVKLPHAMVQIPVAIASAVAPPVIVDHIKEYRDPELMGRLDKALQRVWTAISALHSKNTRGVVAPTEVAGKFT